MFTNLCYHNGCASSFYDTSEYISLLCYTCPYSRMSPTEFSNYIKQRAIQQQNHHSHSGHSAITPVNSGAIAQATNSHMNSIGPVSPARSISPNPLSVAIINTTTTTNSNSVSGRTILPNDSYYYASPTVIASNGASNINTPIAATSMYSPQPITQFGRSNLFDTNNSFGNAPPQNAVNNIATNSSFYSNGYGSIGNAAVNATTATSAGKYSSYIDTSNYYGLQSGQQPTNTLSSLGAPASHINSMTNGHHQTLESNLNTGNINLLVAN